MNDIISNLKSGVIIGVGFLLTCMLGLSAYAYVIGLGGKQDGDNLKSSDWNSLVANVDELKNTTLIPVPVGAVLAFNGTTCPSGWNPADGSGDEKNTEGNNTTLDLRGIFVRGLNDFGTGPRTDGYEDKDNDISGNPRILASLQGDTIRNLTGSVIVSHGGYESISRKVDGVYRITSNIGYAATGTSGYYGAGGWTFDASRVVPTGSDNHPVNVSLIYCVKD